MTWADTLVAWRATDVDPAMAEQYLNDPCIGAALEKMRGKRMAQGMGGDAFGDAGVFRGSQRQATERALHVMGRPSRQPDR